MSEEILVVVATKIPAEFRDALSALAKRRHVTVSALLRSLCERELAGAPDEVTG